jgi:hypothetical protein
VREIAAVRRVRVFLAVSAVGLGAVAAAWVLQARPWPYGELRAAGLAPEPSPGTTYRLDRLTLTTSTGHRVACFLRSPAGPPPRPRSLVSVVLLGGIGTGRRAATLVAPDYSGLVLSCDYPWPDPTTFSTTRLLVTLPRIRRDILGTPEALRVAATYLLSRPEVDPARLAGVGASLGVPLVSAWASRDARVAAIALVMGGAGLAEILAANLGDEVRPAPLRRPAARLLAWLLGPLEPARTVGLIAPRPVLIIGATADQRIPRAATERLFAAAGEPKRLEWFGGPHMLPRDTALLQAVTDSTFAWVTRHLGVRP